MLLAIALEDKEKKPSIHSWNKKLFLKSLTHYECRQHQHHIPCIALLSPKDSPWRKVYRLRDDQASIMHSGIDFALFEELLLHGFTDYFENYTPFTKDGTIRKLYITIPKGRPWLMKAFDALGLILLYAQTSGSQSALQLIFGLAGTPPIWVHLLLYLHPNHHVAANWWRYDQNSGQRRDTPLYGSNRLSSPMRELDFLFRFVFVICSHLLQWGTIGTKLYRISVDLCRKTQICARVWTQKIVFATWFCD